MSYLKVLWENRLLIHSMAIHKLKAQYAEQAFGIGWAIVNPLVYVFSFWFFFAVGLRGGDPINDVPFILWLFPGILSYRMVSGYVKKSTTYIKKNQMLVKTLKFPVMTLPVIEVLKELYVHIIVMLIMCVLYSVIAFSLGSGPQFLPDIYYINLIYYWVMLFLFGIGVSLILSPLAIIIKDVKNLVTALMQPMFWITPAMYPVELGINRPLEIIQQLLNPLYFFVKGYRETFAYNIFFWEQPLYDIYFWCMLIAIYAVGIHIWKRTRELLPDLI